MAVPALCPACRAYGEPLVRHHCHLRDAVRTAVQRALRSQWSREQVDRSFLRSPDWWTRPAVREVMRFGTARICGLCNVVDSCDLETKPGAYFSLSPCEIRAVRMGAGGRRNSGKDFLAALRSVRRTAAPDYHRRYVMAVAVGDALAAGWLAGER